MAGMLTEADVQRLMASPSSDVRAETAEKVAKAFEAAEHSLLTTRNLAMRDKALGYLAQGNAFIAVGDMLVILAAKGSARSAFGMHGLTALLMILAAGLLTMGVA